MKMRNDIYRIFETSFNDGQFIRIGTNRNLNLYIGRDECGRYSFDFRGIYHPQRIAGSEVISVFQTKVGNYIFLRFSLEAPDLLDCFCTFCEDLLTSTSDITDDSIAYNTLYQRYLSWKKLFRPNLGKLSEPEILGLIGELIFMRDYMIPTYGCKTAIDSWTGPEKTHKDYSLSDKWFEIKTISTGKEVVRISSIEQLDSEIDGQLYVYELERMSPSFDGLKLNAIINEIISLLPTSFVKDLFASKLELFGFDFSPEYDNFVYSNTSRSCYLVNQSFPRLKRSDLPIQIGHVQYDLMLSHLEDFKQP